jgi:hypothetical protein
MRLFLTDKKVTIGEYYSFRGRKHYRCVLSSPKGINFLDETTNRMKFKRSFHTKGWTGKNIPKSQKTFTITLVSNLHWFKHESK